MASNDFIDNAISSKVDEAAINDLVGSLDPTSSNPASLPGFPGPGGGGQRMIVRTVTGQQVVRQQNAGQVSRVPQLPTQPNIIRTASGQMVMTGGQRIVQPGQPGTIMLARPQSSQQPQTATTQSYALQQGLMGGQIVRTTSGQQIIVGGPGARPGQPGQPGQQQQTIRPGMQQQQVIQKVVINQPGTRPGQPGSQITVPLQTLQALQAGQGIPTGQPGHLLVKTETGQYQILRVGPPGTQPTPAGASGPTQPTTPVPPSAALTRPPISAPVSLPSRPAVVTSTATRPPLQPPPRLPTVPVQRAPAPPPASTAAQSAASMGQQMTPDTAKVKCKNFLATLLRLASDQPESVARNVRALIQGLVDGRVEPEVFTTKLQKELNSSPQPCLVPFLKKSLPYLQHSLATRELSIEGVLPPTINQVGKLPAAVSQPPGVPMRPPIVGPPSLPRVPLSLPTRPIGGVLSRPPTFTRPTFQPSNPAAVRPIFTQPLPPQGMRPMVTGGPTAPVVKKSRGTYSETGDEDINDVAAMGGVNLAEEANRIMGSADYVGAQIRSCKDETFLQTNLLHKRISKICREKGLEPPPQEVISLVSHATQDRLKTLVSKLAVIAEHRLDIIKTEGQYEVTQDVKGQLRFLEDLDKMEKKRHEEAEREMLLRAAKSRTKTDDPEKEKIKAKAKELQRIEAEQQRHQEANITALAAIGGPKSKKFKLDEQTMLKGGPSSTPLRPRTKRVHLRDVLFLMEQEKDLKRSGVLFKSYCS